jgi:phage shock protein A
MALLERVSTLLRANVNELLRKAENPEKLARQLVLDMENQLMQVKTQVAMALADQHVLDKKRRDEQTAQSEWIRKAELAVAKGQDDLARVALEKAVGHERMAEALTQQFNDQAEETETLKSAYSRLEQKLGETRSRVELLLTQLRRSHAAEKTKTAKAILATSTARGNLARLAERVDEAGTQGYAARAMMALATSESAEDRLEALDRSDQIEALLLELKERQPRLEPGE